MIERPLQVRLGGYAPPDSTHSDALLRIAEGLVSRLGDEVRVSVDLNILDSGQPIQALLRAVEDGRATLCYFSTSYLVARVPSLAIVDLPYLFHSLEQAHAALDGPLGATLSAQTASALDLVPLGYWDNGFRHLSNRHREIRRPEDCAGLRVRLQPNRAHELLFRAFGAEPVTTDLQEGIARLRALDLDAQENPLANFVDYGMQEIHPYLSLTAHVYGARGVYASGRQLASWPAHALEALRAAVADAVGLQRRAAAAREAELKGRLIASGTQVTELDERERSRFRSAAKPVLAACSQEFDPEVLKLVRT